MNELSDAFFDPASHTLIVSARIEDVMMQDEEGDRVVITVENLVEGIEIHDENDRLWRAV